MVRVLRDFEVEDERGRRFKAYEVAAFIRDRTGREIQEGQRTLLTQDGLELLPKGSPGEYRIDRLEVTVREAIAGTESPS